LSDGQKKYRAALQKLTFKGPAGEVRIDENRNGVGTTYITEVVKDANGGFYNKVIKQIPNVTQTLGLSKAEFTKMGLGSRDVPNCP
jgi:branched-chain amino acid transport system substrate-binding protein